jgi:hypothetical protein
MTAMTAMTARPRQPIRTRRRLLLTLHIALSVGWLGASMGMLTLAIAARAGGHAHAAYWAMHLLADVLLVPLSVGVLLVGVLGAATTPWGLLRHRWVLVKLVATCAAVLLSLLALPAMTEIAYRAATEHAVAAERSAGIRLIIAGAVSVSLYLSLTAISVLKPWGRTARGRRQAGAERSPA